MFTFSFLVQSIFQQLKQTSFNKKMNIAKHIDTSSDNSNNHGSIQGVTILFSIHSLTIVQLSDTDIDSDNIGQSCSEK